MKNKFFTVVAAIFITVFCAQAQDTWDLQKCIDYALENNIQVKQQQVNANRYDNELQQAKNNRLPSVSSNLSNNFSFGRTLQYDNTYANYNSNQTGGTVSANISLLNGLILKNSVDMAVYDMQASLQDLERVKDNITLNVAAAYLQILFAEELVKVAEDQLEVTSQQIDRTQRLVDAGSLAKGSLLEIEAQYAQEELNLVNEQNSLQIAYLDLYQLLELPATEEFKIEIPSFPTLTAGETMFNSMDVYRNAVQQRPEVKSAELRLKSYQKQVTVAKGSLFPSLSFGLDYYNSYNDKYRDAFGNNISLSDQLKNNERYGMGFNLSIPLFNRGQTRTQIKNAELQVTSQELELQNTKNVLRKEIEQAYTNALAAMKRYLASEKTVTSMEEAFRYTEERFNVGMVNSLEYNQAKNNLAEAQSNLAQAKYEYIFRTKILDFYNGVPIVL